MYSLKTPKNKYFVLKKHLIIKFITCIVFSVLTISYYMNFWVDFDDTLVNISCHYVVDEDDILPSAEDRNFLPRSNSIFFHETSCRGDLNPRQACAIESASRAHPRRHVYVMFSAAVSDVVYQKSYIAELRRLPNVRFARVHITDYAKNTPLEAMVASKPFSESKWPVQHTSDVLRYLTLYKWGGVYLDMDMLVVKSLKPLGHNWVAREDDELVNAAAIAISMDHLGRKLAKAVINEVEKTFRPEFWAHNGPGAITRALHKMCGTYDLVNSSHKTCQGLGIYGPKYFYPIDYSQFNEYFNPGELKNVENAYTHHFWNTFSHDVRIKKDSPYQKLAQKFCPIIYKMNGEEPYL